MLIKKVKICNLQTINSYSGGRVWFYNNEGSKISIGSKVISDNGVIVETDLANLECKACYSTGYSVYNGFRTNVSSISSDTLYCTPSYSNSDTTQYFQIEFKTPVDTKYMRYLMAASDQTYTKSADIEVTFEDGTVETINVVNTNSTNGYVVRVKFPGYDISKDVIVATTDLNNFKDLNKISSIEIDSYEKDDTVMRYALSVDNRSTWNVFKEGNWNTIDLSNLKTEGNTTSELINASASDLRKLIVDGTTLDVTVLLSSNSSEFISPILKKIKVITSDLLNPDGLILSRDE